MPSPRCREPACCRCCRWRPHSRCGNVARPDRENLLMFDFIAAPAKLSGIDVDIDTELAAGITDRRARKGVFDSISPRAPKSMRVARIPHPIDFDIHILAQRVGAWNRDRQGVALRTGKGRDHPEYLPAIQQSIAV